MAAGVAAILVAVVSERRLENEAGLLVRAARAAFSVQTFSQIRSSRSSANPKPTMALTASVP